MKLILSAGHSDTPGRDMGAVGNGFVEGKETARVRRAIYDQMKAFGQDVHRDPDNTVLSESLAIFKQITDADTICIDYHFNAAASKNAKGTEVIVPNNATELELTLAKMIADCISKTLNIPLRGGDKTGRKGVKYESETPHKSLGWMRMPGVNVLIEICFISNPDEMQSYADNFLFLCCNLSNVINDFIEKNKCNVTKQPVYIVKSGDSLSKIAKQKATTVSRLKSLNALKSDVIQVGQKLFI